MHLLAFLGIKVIPVLGERDISGISSSVMVKDKNINKLEREWRTGRLQRNTAFRVEGFLQS